MAATEYKQSKIGQIPADWEVVEIKQIAGEVITGTTPSTKVEEYWKNGTYMFVTPTDFNDKKYIDKTERKVSYKGVKKAKLVSKSSVLVTCIGSIGEVALATEECITNQQINSIICKEEINPEYIYYAIKYNKPRLIRWAGITTNPIIKKSFFEKFLLALPNYPEQQSIAKILSTCDKTIQKVDEIIAKTERLKKGLMQELLTKGIGHEEFKDTKIGRIPKDWDVQKVCNIFKVETGTTPSTKKEDYWKNGDIEWITPADMSKVNAKPLLPESNRKVTEKAVKDTNLTLMPKDSIIISTRAPVGYVALVDKEATFNQGCKGLVPKKEVDTTFYCYYLLHQSRKLDLMSGQTTFKELTKTLLENFDIVEPTLPEQQKIADILSTVDKKLKLEKQRKKKLVRIKKGLMNDLLTGKKRLKVEV